MLAINPIEIELAEFTMSFSMQVCIFNVNGIELKKMLGFLEEMKFELSWIVFALDRRVRWRAFNLRFGFNAKTPGAYHLVLSGRNVENFSKPLY